MMKKIWMFTSGLLLIVTVVVSIVLMNSIKENEQLKKDMDMMLYQIEDITEYYTDKEKVLLNDLEIISHKRDDLSDVVSDLNTKCNLSQVQLMKLEEALNANDILLDDFDRYILKDMNNVTDTSFIVEDLMGKNELIGADAVLGGTMFFYEIHLISNQWAMAYFEDGHITGRGIYAYEILEDNQVEWERIIEVLN